VRIILYTGKGGVGKTTLSAATALHCASLGHHTLVVSTDIAHSLADALQTSLGNEPQASGSIGLEAAELDSASELELYWGDIKRRIAAVLRTEGVEATVAGELAVLPGLDEIISLVRLKKYYDEQRYEALIIDSAPTGAAMRLLAAPDLTRWYTRYLTGITRGIIQTLLPSVKGLLKIPISEESVQERLRQLVVQIQELRTLLTDSHITSVRLVLNPDQMSLRETQRAYTYFNLFGLTVDAVYINRIYPDQITDPYFQHWVADQSRYCAQIYELFAPLPIFEVPLQRQEVLGAESLGMLAKQIYGSLDPLPPLAQEQPVNYVLENGRYILSLRVMGVAAGQVELQKQGDELQIRLGTFRRTLTLPQYLAGTQPSWANLEGEYLKVTFEAAGG
jgi:arsenite/tail-anchored protein-transporting ATPase